MMVKIKTAVFTIIIALLLFGVFLSFVSNSNLGLSMTQYQGVTENVPNTQEDNDIRKTNQKLEGVLFYQQQVIEIRNNISRLLNAKQHELARLQCEKVEKENKTVEQTSATGGWCIHNTKELGEGGFHKTDLKLAQALALFFKGKRVASFGDGPGRYKKILDESGQLAVYDAYDGAPYSEQLSEGRVKFLDLTLPQFGLPVYDYVISLEVAEHIPKDFEAIYVDNIFRHAKEGIVLSWAWPGQEGHSHVNGKLFKDVVILMEKNGFVHDVSASNILKQSSTLVWLQKSTNVYTRKQNISEEVLKQNS